MGIAKLPSIHPLSLLFLPLLLIYAQEDIPKNCTSSFQCGTKNIQFPLYNNDTHPGCGIIPVTCTGNSSSIYLGWSPSSNNMEFVVDRFLSNQSAKVFSPKLQDFIRSNSCEIFSYLKPLYYSPIYIKYTISPFLSIFICDTSSANLKESAHSFFNASYYSYENCPGSTIYYPHPNYAYKNSSNFPGNCTHVQLPIKEGSSISKNLFSFLGNEFTLGWNVSSECTKCHIDGGQCSGSIHDFHCAKENKKEKKGDSAEKKGDSAFKNNQKIILATVIPGCAILMIVMAILTIRYRKKWKDASTTISSRNISSNPSSKSDLEGGGFFFGVRVFSYAELEEATDYFDPSRELGDGGFGAVYHGKLRDGREVAVKRLYEHNYRRATQFRNEIEILTRLHHKNLVTLYGCTSRQSRELILVYEYISNGTVADHLHGDVAKNNPLRWHTRMNIAIETASALSYLHKSDIIHRDVKTNNILLDNDFYVKVADFGLSRLFPNDVTHVSTAPQGTPGYVDPEYYQCYQLTDKSDVYSFGVVLIELITSMPAIDINRNRSEINLANLAINKIQNRGFEELIDPMVGFESDPTVARMVTSVAELAFRCLQLEKEMRPSMDEVLDSLIEIRDYKDEKNSKKVDTKPESPEADHVVLLKMIKTKNVQISADSVVDKWVSAPTSISNG